MEDKELNAQDLDNVFGGMPQEMVNDKVVDNASLYREKQIEKLKQYKDTITNSNELTVEELDNFTAGIKK